MRLTKSGRPWGDRWHPELCTQADPIITLYKAGFSTRQVAQSLALSSAYVARLCRGVTRSRSEAAQLRQPMRPSAHWRTCRAQARRLTEQELGRELERWEHVHHTNGDYTDQRRENREVLSSRDHGHVHHPPNPIPRGQRLARQAYVKALYERRKRPAICLICGGDYLRGANARSVTCSLVCRGRYISQLRRGLV